MTSTPDLIQILRDELVATRILGGISCMLSPETVRDILEHLIAKAQR